MTAVTPVRSLDPELIRGDFPILRREVNGRPLVYLDTAATSQKPTVVLDAERIYYERHNANVHRGVHTLAEEATAGYEAARAAVAGFIHAPDPGEVVFTKNATEAINLVAYGLTVGSADLAPLRPGDEVLVTEMEHHSNLVPWQLACERSGATLRWIGLTDEGRLDLSHLGSQLTERTRLLAVVDQSNILGTRNPVTDLVRAAHQVGALVLVDGCQSVPHTPVDVTASGADLLAFSGHKMLGPTGIGALWGRAELLAALPPFLGGGEMIESVTMAGSTFAAPPHRFEAGTPMIAQAFGLHAAVDYLTALGMEAVDAHETEITGYALEQLAALPGVSILGPRDTVDRGPAISFLVDGVHPHDVGQLLDRHGVAVRVGHHCARPVCLRFNTPATSRASFGPYTTRGDIDTLILGLLDVQRVFGRGARS